MKFKLIFGVLFLILLSTMNIYSRALRHINMKDVKEKHQQKNIEQKVKKRIEQNNKKFIFDVIESNKFNWRKELNEQMTTTDVFYTSLPAMGDVDLADGTWGSLSDTYGASLSGQTLTLSGDPSPFLDNSAIATISGGKDYDTLVIDVVSGGTTFYVDSAFPPYTNYFQTSSSGRYTIPLRSGTTLRLIFGSVGSGTVRFTPTWQRRSPKTVMVSLDSPEASAFMRTDPIMTNLSAEERKQKLKEMLDASDEYVMKMFGLDFPGSNAVPPGEAGDTPGVDIAQILPAQQQRGATGVGVPDTRETNPGANIPPPSQMNYPKEWLPKQARKSVMPMVASYELHGEILLEKKKLKSPEEILSNIL